MFYLKSRTDEHAFLYSTGNVHLKPENKARFCAMTPFESCSLQSQWSSENQLAVGSLWLAFSWLRVLILQVQICVFFVFVGLFTKYLFLNENSPGCSKPSRLGCSTSSMSKRSSSQVQLSSILYLIIVKSTSPCQKKGGKLIYSCKL